MRIAPAEADRDPTDLTARARIRDAAIDSFAADGFDTSFRTIAARAGVSPGLITHHFGSKAVLRAQCDDEVLRRYRAVKTEGISNPREQFLKGLTAPGMSATVVVYMLRAVLAGGPSASAFLDRLAGDMAGVMAQGVAEGIVRPSRDEAARLRYLTDLVMGTLLVRFVTNPGLTPEEFMASLHTPSSDTILPMLELFTEGLLANSDLLDDYVSYLWEPPDGPTTGADGAGSGPLPPLEKEPT